MSRSDTVAPADRRLPGGQRRDRTTESLAGEEARGGGRDTDRTRETRRGRVADVRQCQRWRSDAQGPAKSERRDRDRAVAEREAILVDGQVRQVHGRVAEDLQVRRQARDADELLRRWAVGVVG